MAYLSSYKRINRLVQEENFEPMVAWGLRMAVAGCAPVIWGVAAGKVTEAIWIALTAEAVSWIELKGSLTWRFRTLFIGALLAVGAGLLGFATGNSLILSSIGMLVVGFLATLLKSMGDRASGLAVCLFLLFIICNAYPPHSLAEAPKAIALISIGAVWAFIVGLVSTAFMPEQEPFRRHVALIWRAIAQLTDAVSKSDNRPGYTGSLAKVYARERDVRTAINNSFEFYSQAAHQASTADNNKYQLAQMRKVAGLVAVNVIAMGDEMQHISISELDKALRIKAAALFGALQEACSRTSVFVISRNQEELLLAKSQISRMRKLIDVIRNYPMPEGTRQREAIARILQLADRTIKLLESGLEKIAQTNGEVRAFRSYSLIKTVFVLRPGFFLRNLRTLFHINTFTFRYAIRSAVGATIALILGKWLIVDHGFWLPFTFMIIIQPHFNATFRKAVDRVTGTLGGVIAGGLLLKLPAGYLLHEGILFLTFVLMVYYMRRKYAISAFFITLNLVLLFNLEATYSDHLMVTRVVATIGGAILAVGSGWLLLPTWDKKLLPRYVLEAVIANYEYFSATFFDKSINSATWTRLKRNAESKNSNAFDSFNRYMQEPGSEQSEQWYDLITSCVRISRNLNNIHMEQDERTKMGDDVPEEDAVGSIMRGKQLFCRLLSQVADFHKRTPLPDMDDKEIALYPNTYQVLLLEKVIVELNTMLADLAALKKTRTT